MNFVDYFINSLLESQFHKNQQCLNLLFLFIITSEHRNLHQLVSIHHLMILKAEDSFLNKDFEINLIIRIILLRVVHLLMLKESKSY